MSYKATNWAYEMRITGPAKPVLVALADMADEDASCYPGQEKLSAMTGLSVSTVARALQRLEDLGLLIRQHRYGSRGYRTSDRYRLQLTVDIPETLPVTEPTRRRAYKAESESLPVTVQIPTRHCDGAEENHQLEPPVKPSGGARARAKTPQPVDNYRPDLFCDAHMPDGPGMTKCPQCGDRRRSRADWDRRNTKPTPIPPRDLVDPESCDHKFIGGWCVWCPTPQVVLV